MIDQQVRAAASKPGFGFLTIAIGADRYLKQAEILSLSLRRNMPGVPIAIVSDSDRLKPHCDLLLPVDRSMPIATAQKLLLDVYSPFDETLFIDSDCVAVRDFSDQIARIRQFPFSPVIQTLTPPDGTDEYFADLGMALRQVGGSAFPKFNGGVYFFRRGDASKAVFALARDYFRHYRDYGIKPFDRGGPGDETVIGLALARLGMLDLYDDGGRLMRTPTGLRGRLLIDPVKGACSFERAEGMVHPAICHFAGPYLLTPEYRLAEIALRTGISQAKLSGLTKARATCGALAARLMRLARYRVDGVRKRVDRMLVTGGGK
ncbi:hypothetical protein [Burkholderia pyrrocinia]|uniref:hypothetical protein n=1 Tax=Burkholderia pyrrocinia TaxID=60550 RepID=UPI000ABB2609|nr:hypothetical protein [Burkholderia pyrrocinia]